MILNQKKYDHTVVLYCPRRGKESNYLLEQGFQMHNGSVTNRLGIHTLGEIAKLFFFLKENEFDIMFAHQPIGAIIGITAGCLARVPIRIYSTGGLKWVPGLKSVRNELMKLGESFIIKLASAVFLVNREDKANFELGCAMGKAYYVGPRGGCGVDTKKFNPHYRVANRKAARYELGIDSSMFVVGYSSRCVWEKGFKEIMEVAKTLDDQIVFQIFGDGKDVDGIRKLVRDIGLSKKIVFQGYKQNIQYFMTAFDIFILPSYREGLPVSLLESLAMGIPSIASNIRGCRDLIDHNRTGLLISVKDATSLNNAILLLRNSPKERKRLGENAAAYIAENFDEKYLVAKTNETIGQIVQSKVSAVI